MEIIFDEKRNGLRLLAYSEELESYIEEILLGNIKRIIANIRGLSFIHKFRKINIIFNYEKSLVNLEIKESKAQGPEEINDIELARGTILDHQVFKDSKLGYSLKKDVQKGTNRIYINLDYIFYRSSENEPDDNKLEEIVIKKIIQTVTHELAHIWHIRSHDYVKERKRIFDRLLKSVQNQMMNDFSKLHLHSKWFYIRNGLDEFMNLIYQEGIADFFALQVSNKIDFTNSSLLEWYKKSYKEAASLNSRLGKVYELFRRVCMACINYNANI